MMNASSLLDIQAHAAEEYPREACGVLIVEAGRERYVACRNQAVGTDHFVLAPEDYADAEERGEIIAIVHSHPDVSPKPSQADRVSCEASGLPWIIVAVSKGEDGVVCGGDTESFAPEGYEAPLVGREFAHGVLDCYSLIQDWYRLERKVALPDFERRDDWWRRGENLYMRHYAYAGFRPLAADESIEPGDAIVMQVLAGEPNHAGIYLGDGKILHHLHGRLSTRDVYGGYWVDVTRVILRYCGQGEQET